MHTLCVFVFEEDIADQVLQIPISRRGGEDFVSWPFTRFSDYTISSAYNLARKDKFFLDRSKQGGGANSATEADNIFWKKLWSIKAPGKMKINLWRFAHDCLPSGVQLCKRHIQSRLVAAIAIGRNQLSMFFYSATSLVRYGKR
jgi:hypothetical protein